MALTSEILATFRSLHDEANVVGEPEPTAMTLATADAVGRVSARIVLLKSFDERGFVFHSNYDSIKGIQLAAHKNAALCLLWKTLRDQVQVRIEGIVEKVSAEESDEYFAYRPRASQIGAWASLQSQTLVSRSDLETRIAEFEQHFAGQDVPRPPHWGGYRLVPDMIEFWYGAKFRLHERVRYERMNEDIPMGTQGATPGAIVDEGKDARARTMQGAIVDEGKDARARTMQGAIVDEGKDARARTMQGAIVDARWSRRHLYP